MQTQPLVSVVLPTHNREPYIRKAVESVLGQTYRNFELIVVDDYSTDRTSEILQDYERVDSRVKVVHNKENIGFVRSLTKGILPARGVYLARIDDDDFWCDVEKLAKQVRFLEAHPDHVLCGGGVIIVDTQGKELLRFLDPERDEEIRKTVLFLANFIHSSVVMRKSAYDAVGGYDEALAYSEDRDLWFKLGKVGKFYNFQDHFVVYRRGHDNRTGKEWCQIHAIDAMLQKKYRNDYPNYAQAVVFSRLTFLYYALGLRALLYPISSVLRKLVFFCSYLISGALGTVPKKNPPFRGIHVVLMGPDGVGKTTMCKGLAERVKDLPFRKMHQYHERFRLFPTLGVIRRRIFPRKSDLQEVPMDQQRTMGMLRSLIHVVYYGLEGIFSWPQVWLMKARGNIILCDRYFYDFIAVFPQSTVVFATFWAISRIIPKPDILFILEASPREIYTRKQELSIEEIERQARAFRNPRIARLTQTIYINTEGPVENTLSKAEREIKKLVEKKYVSN